MEGLYLSTILFEASKGPSPHKTERPRKDNPRDPPIMMKIALLVAAMAAATSAATYNWNGASRSISDKKLWLTDKGELRAVFLRFEEGGE